jgi:hypothetical protein
VLPRTITRRIFLVPLANNDHGKTTIIRSLVRQGERSLVKVVKRGVRKLLSPWGRRIDALVIPRSYQETLSSEFKTVENALNSVDPLWRQRDLIVFPSHLYSEDCEEMIRLGHGAGFDVVVVPVLLQTGEIAKYQSCLELYWDERWTLSNDKEIDNEGQREALGHDLWAWVSAALEHR